MFISSVIYPLRKQILPLATNSSYFCLRHFLKFDVIHPKALYANSNWEVFLGYWKAEARIGTNVGTIFYHKIHVTFLLNTNMLTRKKKSFSIVNQTIVCIFQIFQSFLYYWYLRNLYCVNSCLQERMYKNHEDTYKKLSWDSVLFKRAIGNCGLLMPKNFFFFSNCKIKHIVWKR